MTDLPGALALLSRPRLLIRAARFGLAEYRRTPTLRRMFAAAGAHGAAQITAFLMRREAEMDNQRRAQDAAYSVARHVEVLIALMAEAQQLPRAAAAARPAAALRAGPQPKASGISDLRRATKASSASHRPASITGA